VSATRPAEMATADPDLVTALTQGQAAVDAATARWLLMLAEFDRREAWRTDGVTSTVAWLRRECRMNAPASKNLLAAARALHDLPATREAFAEGAISLDHVRAIMPAVEYGEQARRADPIFARAALWMTPRQVARVVATWADIAKERAS